MGHASEGHAIGEVRQDEAGFALITILAILIPLALTVGASLSLMQGRSAGLLAQIRNERAFLAAESAIDEALFQTQTGSLTSGVRIEGDLGNGMMFTAMPLYLGSDGLDNDGDTQIDEADEDIFRLTIAGIYGSSVKKVAAYLGRTSNMPTVKAAVTFAELDPGTEPILQIDGSSFISGWEGGNPASGTGAPGVAIPIGSTAVATGRFTSGSITRVDGTPTGLVESDLGFDLAGFVSTMKNSADMVLGGEVSGAILGDVASDDFKIMYGNGAVTLKSGTMAAGILVVEGFLELEDNAHFHGLVIVLGSIEVEANSSINGGVIVAPGPEDGVSGSIKLGVEVESGSRIHYSQAMLDKIMAIMPGGKWVTFNGWQELSRHETVGF